MGRELTVQKPNLPGKNVDGESSSGQLLLT